MAVVNLTQAQTTVDRSLPLDAVGGHVDYEVIISWEKAQLESTNQFLVAGPFPSNVVLDGYSFRLATEDLEVGGPLIDLDVGIGDSDGVIDTMLINDGGTDFDDAGTKDWTDLDDLDTSTTLTSLQYAIGDKYLIFDFNAGAGTGGADGVTTMVAFRYARGLSNSEAAT